MAKDYIPQVGDVVMVDVDALPESTKGTPRNKLIHMMEVRDGERAWTIMGTATDKKTKETYWVLRGATYFYKAEELMLIGRENSSK